MSNRLTPEQFAVKSLGPGRVPSPLKLSTHVGDGLAHYVPEGTRVLYKASGEREEDFDMDLFMERAGPSIGEGIERPGLCQPALPVAATMASVSAAMARITPAASPMAAVCWKLTCGC